MPALTIRVSDEELRELKKHLLLHRGDASQNEYFHWLMKKDMKGEIGMKNTVEDFMMTETRRYDRGYRVYLSDAPEFATDAVVEDADGKRELVDISDRDWEDGESMADVAVEAYERGTGKMEKEVRNELVGNEYTLFELDNEMMELGFKSAMNEISTDIVQSGSIAWYPKKDDNDRFMNVFINVVKSDKENPVLKVTDAVYEY